MLVFILSSFTHCLNDTIPTWPSRYHLRGTWQIPFWQIRQPFLVTTDLINGRQSESAYSGLSRSIKFAHHPTHGPLSISRQVYRFNGTQRDYCHRSSSNQTLTEFLPSSTDGWVYQGTRSVLGINCSYWRKTPLINDWYYEFYVAVYDRRPVRYYQHGRSIRGSHPADYIFDIEDWGPTINELEFSFPPDCPTAFIPPGPSFGIRRKSHKAANWEFTEDQPVCVNVSNVENPAPLPVNFSWRQVGGIVPRVRDQATCGSCWAVAAVQAITAQLSLKLGKYTEASAQQIVDCAWGGGNAACDGGEGWQAYANLAGKPIVSEVEYPYIGIGGYCPERFGGDLGFGIEGCSQFKVNGHQVDHGLLKQALYRYGPLMVSIRAGTDQFVQVNGSNPYFSNREVCDPTIWDRDWLDHGVLLTGWVVGTDGRKFLEIENSWSENWGDKGFGYIDEEADCGIEGMVLLPNLKAL